MYVLVYLIIHDRIWSKFFPPIIIAVQCCSKNRINDSFTSFSYQIWKKTGNYIISYDALKNNYSFTNYSYKIKKKEKLFFDYTTFIINSFIIKIYYFSSKKLYLRSERFKPNLPCSGKSMFFLFFSFSVVIFRVSC